MSRKKAIIIGAGYGGIALANLLAASDYDVEVFEKNETAGGRLTAFKQDGFTFDIGPSWYLMPEVFESYYHIFGQSAKKRLELTRLKPGYKVFFENKPPIIMDGSLVKDRKTFESLEPGAGKKLTEYVRRSSAIYRASVDHFLYTNFQRPHELIRLDILRQLPLFLRTVMQPLDRYVSHSFRDQRLKQLLEYHMVFLGSSPFQAPALYSLMSHLDFESGVYYPKRGFMSLVDDLIALGDSDHIRYHYDSPVKEICVVDGHARGVRLKDGTSYDADVVVSNADLHFTETTLLKAEYQTYPESYWKKRQPGPSAMVISLGIKGTLPQLLHHSLFFVDEWRKNFEAIYESHTIPEHASVYICNASKSDPHAAPKGHENIFILVPLPAGVSLTPAAQNSLAERIIDTVATAIKAPTLRQRIVTRRVFGPNDFGARYNAWQLNAFGGESHLLTQSVIFRTGNHSKKVRNLFYVGAGTLPGVGLPMTLMSAQLAYKRIIKDRSGKPITHLKRGSNG